MNRKRIEVGDIVHVDFNNSKFTLCSQARVEGIPVATGDSWIFNDLESNNLYYVSEGCTVSLVEKGPSDLPF